MDDALDTSTEAAMVQSDIHRRMGGARRVELACRMSTDARELCKAGIAHRHPEYSERQCHMAMLRVTLGDELVRAAWPGEALVDP